MELTLGLDIGSTSIGWALIDEEGNQLIASGIRIFPLGVNSTQSGEKGKNEERRIARGTRRVLRRRAQRKKKLKQLLIDAGLLPTVVLESRDHAERIAWEREAFQSSDPYALRAKALDEPLEPYELGRALLHLSQRRGFQSNRKTDRGNAKETEGLLGQITELKSKIESAKARTLGEYLHGVQQQSELPANLVRLRNREDEHDFHTNREMHKDEFNLIWTAQTPHHSCLSDELKEQIKNAIFFQRPIRPPSPGLIGACELNSRLPRASRADRRYQQLRMHQEVNNLRVIELGKRKERALSPDERMKLLNYLASKKEATFDAIRKHLFDNPESVRFNLERGDRKKMHGMPMDHQLASKKLVGKSWWKVDNRIKDWIVAAIIDDDEKRLEYLLKQAQMESPSAEFLLNNTRLDSGYGSYSLKAIKDLLPHVMQGMPLYSRDESVPCAYRAAGYVAPWEKSKETSPKLGTPPEVTNPIVRQALHEIRKVVNAILREHVDKQHATLKTIRIELARDAQKSITERAKIVGEQRKNEKERESAKKFLEDYAPQGRRITQGDILKYRLWKQQEECCIYSGKNIPPEKLFSSETDVDHVLPRWKSNDNSQMNKVVCYRSENAKKKDQTPFAWLAKRHPKTFEEVLQRAKKLPYKKYKRFLMENIDSDWANRQLNDTAYITTQVKSYLQTLGTEKVTTVSGRFTSILRHRWGLETTLEEMEDSPAWEAAKELRPGEKNRLDHRHHTIDAIVVALSSEKRIFHLNQVLAYEHAREVGYLQETTESIKTSMALQTPWANFRNEIIESLREINVSYRVNRKASGELHEATIYGKTETPGVVTVRKPVAQLSLSEVANIRDKADREIVEARLKVHGLTSGRGQKAKLTKEVWEKPLFKNEAKDIELKKVRILKNESTVQPIRGGTAYVKPGNTHHLCLFAYKDAKGQQKQEAVFCTMIEAVDRIRNKQPLIQRTHPTIPEAEFLFSLSNNELVLIEHKGEENLYRLARSSSTSQQMWFKHHCAAGASSSKIGEISKYPSTLYARKVTIDPVGNLRWAND